MKSGLAVEKKKNPNAALTQGHKIELRPSAGSCSAEPRVRSVLLTLSGDVTTKMKQLRRRRMPMKHSGAASHGGGAYSKISSDELVPTVHRSSREQSRSWTRNEFQSGIPSDNNSTQLNTRADLH